MSETDELGLRLIAKYERQRSRLTFVPNTLGNMTSSDAMSARLLQGLAEEEGWLLKEDQAPHFTIEQAADNEGADTATRELLEEIDRSLKGYEQAAKSNSWLGDAGLNAEQSLVSQAGQAMQRGQRESTVDLSQFVASAIMLDGGTLHGHTSDPFFTIELPHAWSHGLDEMPGYDPTTRRIVLTTDMEVTSTNDDKPVAFLGRAHPLVRRALDRVRHFSYGGDANRSLDIRVSAVETDSTKPALLLTFLGKVNSQAGREYERVIAVLTEGRGSCRFFGDTPDWVDLIGKGKAIQTGKVWERHFASGWADAIEETQAYAARQFDPLAASFVEARRADLEKEQADLEKWLRQRAEDITGEQAMAAEQQELFRTGKAEIQKSSWQSIVDPKERLAAYVSDATRPSARRSEADGVLRLYTLRSSDLKARLTTKAPEIVPLGMLMLVPKGR